MHTEKEYLVGREISALRCESVGEYSLPDYNGDVKKIMTVKTRVFPTGKFVGDDTLEFSGSVGYEVVYLDAENNLTHAEFSTDYDAAVKINADTYIDSDVRSNISGCNVRLVGPRKFSVKCALDNYVCISEKKEYSIGGDAFMEYEPELLTTEVEVYAPVFASADAREISEELVSLEGAIADEVEVLLSDAAVEVTSVIPSDSSCTVSGNLKLSALIKNVGFPPQLVQKDIPYSESVLLPSADGMATLDARVEITSLRTGITPGEDGVVISAVATVCPKISAGKNNALGLVKDGYLKERGTVNEYADFSYTEHICNESKEESFDLRRSLEELGVEAVGEIVYAEAHARVEKCEKRENVVEISGEIRFSGIACQVCEDDCVTCAPIKFTAPFTQNVNIDCQNNGNIRVNCYVDVREVKMNIDADNVYATVVLSSHVSLSVERRQRCLGASYITDEDYSHDDSLVSVYYPDGSESLFEIAKRFHTSTVKIAQSNRLSESVFAAADSPLGTFGVGKLLIK